MSGQTTDHVNRSLDHGDRITLGRRARKRREKIGLSREAVASATGIDAAKLMRWEELLPQHRSNDEERWEAALQVPYGWLRDPSLSDPGPPLLADLHPPVCVDVAGEIRLVGCWLVRENPFRRTFDFASLTEVERRDVEMFAIRYGVDGEEESTLQTIGARFSVTRERVRQVVDGMVARAHGLHIPLPVLEQLAREIEPRLPSTIADLDRECRHILGEALSFESACRFTREILGRSLAVVTERPAEMQVPWTKVAVANDSGLTPDIIKAVRDTALALIRHCGAAQVTVVSGMASNVLGSLVQDTVVVQCCTLIPGFEWLLKDFGWFWFGPDFDNRLNTVVKKILSIANRNVEAEEIHAGLTRSRRRKYGDDGPRFLCTIEPPLYVVEQVVKRIPGVACVQYDDFVATDPIDPAAVLSDAEINIVECIKRHGGAVAKFTLDNELVSTGRTKFMALQVAIDSTPILVRLDIGLYGLRGYSFSPGAVDEQAKLVGGLRLKHPPMTPEPDGRYRFTSELSEYAERTRVFSAPVSLARVMKPGEYTVEGSDITVLLVKVDDNYRLNRLAGRLKTAGYRAGDTFSILIDVAAMRITIPPKADDSVSDAEPIGLPFK